MGLAVARAHDNVTGGASRPMRDRVIAAAAFATLAMLPDFDVVTFRLGIPYASILGHRGLWHSAVVAVVVGVVAAVVFARSLRVAWLPTVIACVAAVMSHGVLDMLTDGGEGIAFLWPASSERFFFPVQPLPVAPIGRAFVSARGVACMVTELLWFLPFLLFAAWPRIRRDNAVR